MSGTDNAPASEQPDRLVRVEFEGPVMWVWLDRSEAMNAITLPLLDELARVLREVGTYPSVRVVTLTGLGRAFSARVDLKVLIDRDLVGGRIGDDFDGIAAQITWLLQSMSVVTIAAVNGACFTCSLEIALACDLMVAADEAVLGDTHAKWALGSTWGMTPASRFCRRPGTCAPPLVHRPDLHRDRGRRNGYVGAARTRRSATCHRSGAGRGNHRQLCRGHRCGQTAVWVADYSLLDDGLHMERMFDLEVTGATQRLQGFIDRSREVK